MHCVDNMYLWFFVFKWTSFNFLDRITWTKDGNALDLESGNDFTYDSKRGELTIGSVTSRLAGVYACSATNAYGSAHSNTMLLKEAGKQLSDFSLKGFWLRFYNSGLWQNSTVVWSNFPFLATNGRHRDYKISNVYDSFHFMWFFVHNLVLDNNFADVIEITSKNQSNSLKCFLMTKSHFNHGPFSTALTYLFVSNNCSENGDDIFG